MWCHELALGYGYLDPGDGFVVEIFHDGQENSVSVIGASKGLVSGAECRGAMQHKRIGHADGSALTAVAICCGMLVATQWDATQGGVDNLLRLKVTIPLLFLGFFTLATAIVRHWRLGRRYPHALVKYVPVPENADE